MHPALSVILFTTASGAGYGLLALLGVFAAAQLVPAERWFAVAAFGLAFAAVTGGLLASTFHLGRPERAWRAFSQWRSSWLSREGVLSVATYLPALVFAAGWVLLERNDSGWAVVGVASTIMALATIACTGMIYASLKPIPRWANRWTVPVYLLLGLMSGALWLQALLHVFGMAVPVASWLALATIILAAAAKQLYWRHIDTAPATATAESATGLGHIGRVRLLEAPHTGGNYLMQEMGFRVARKHAKKLRGLALLLGFALPLVLTLPALFEAAAVPGWIAAATAVLAAASSAAGVLIERWLFFAEAKHAVTLYYGAAAV
jgi:sulfite dehydrogenase (quinone) subunit SoeC